jgi:subfamily B ATP-binding cassette protein MsbA
MSAAPTPETPRKVILARMWREYIRPRWPWLAGAIAAAAVVAIATAQVLRLLEPAMNGLFVEQNPQDLWLIPLAIVGVAIIRGLAAVVQAALVNRLGHGMVGEMQVRLFGRMVRSDLAQLRSAHSGRYVSSVLFDANLVREAFTQGMVNYVQSGLIVLTTVGSMFWLDWSLTLLVLLAMPLVSWVMGGFAKRTKKAAEGAMGETAALSTALMESLDGVKVIQIEGREADEQDRVQAVVDRRQGHVIKGANARSFAAPATELVSTFVIAAVLAYGGWRSQSGGMNVGEFTAFIAFLMAAGQALRQLANLQGVMAEGFAGAERLFRALDVEPEIVDRPDALTLGDGRLDVAFEGVSFRYGPRMPALKDVSLTVRQGESVALVGPSGGGKSTILNLIPRFYDANDGRVTVGGTDVRDLTLSSLRAHIALVTQEPFLFDDTIAANIAYARPGASPAEIEEAARAAAAHDFILALPDGYQTRAGEAGARLSGGQRQRIAIARAFLKDAPILLLDEATSALDTESEAQVQAALERLMEGRATLMIAHRLSTVKSADRIYVIDGGRVVETGTHAALVKAGRLYARLAKSQSLEGAPA